MLRLRTYAPTLAACMGLAAMLLAAPAGAGRTAVSATGTLSRSSLGPNSMNFMLVNSGDALTGFSLQLKAGFVITQMSMSGQACAMTGNEAVCKLPLAAGSTTFGTITTDKLYPDGSGATLILSSATGSTGTALVSGPGATTPPPTTPPCNCLTLIPRIVPSSIKFTNPGDRGGMHLEFTVFWTLSCTAGAGGCNGTLDLVAPRGASYTSYFKKPGAHIACAGACAQVTTGFEQFVLVGNRGLGGDRRGKTVGSIPIVIKRTCQGKPTRAITLNLVFDGRTGLVDKHRSKLS